MSWLIFLFATCTLPFLLIGFIRKLKALLQNRQGPPLWQSLFNILKLFHKRETISNESSWLFRASCAINLAALVVLALAVPWISFKPDFPADDLFLIVYLLAGIRFLSMLAAMDAGSPFGAFGAPREAVLSMLVEPAIVLSLVGLAIPARSTDLGTVFQFPESATPLSIWLLAGIGLFLASLVELSRMPVDDPTTHLELTMVHEALTIENSGPNLALVELGYSIKLLILYGLSAQCFIHALLPPHLVGRPVVAGIVSLVLLFTLAGLTAVTETLAVKLQWRKNPEFIAYSLTMALLASLAALVDGGFQ